MKKLFINRSIATLLLFALNLSVSAQQQKPAAVADTSASCNNDAAVEIIQQQLAETRTFDDEVGRITAVIRAADLLWPYEEKKSRAAFVEGLELAIQDFKDKGDEPKLEGRGIAITTPDMRYTVISAIAKRDLAWSRKLTDQMLNDQLNEARDKGSANAAQEIRTAQKLLSTATSLLTSDQAAALSFAGQSLRFPASMRLTIFLYELAEVNRAAADQFYQSALAAYAKAPMDRFLYLSAYPFGNNRDAGEMPGYTIYQVPEGFTPNSNLQRLLVQTLLNRTREQVVRPSELVPGSRLTEQEQMWLALTRLEIQIVRNLPDLAPAAEKLRVDLSAQLPENSQKKVGSITSAQNRPRGTFAERVEAAEKNPNVDLRDQYLVAAVTGAPAEEDFDFVLRVANKVADPTTRGQLLNWFYFNRTNEAIKQKQLVQARTLAAKVEELDHRGFLYFRIADESLKENVDQTQAREMLEEVVVAAAKAPSTMVSARTQLGVAYLYTKIDAARAIAVLGDAVKTINKLEAPDFSRQFVMRKIEGKTFGSYAAFVTPGFNPENAVREIAKSDFDGTLYQANNFTNKTLRALTTFAVMEPCLKVSKQPLKGKQKTKASKL
ncbi:MAG: hypothetical protein AABN95_12065 [Acidobacteriota bacterium]